MNPLWERARSGRAPLPTLTEPIEADLLVVGLGASGLAAVDAALDRGLRVIGIDASDIASGAAGRNAGFALAGMAPFHHDAVRAIGRERAVALYQMTLAELRDRPPPTFVGTGSLRIAASDAELDDCRAQFSAMRADGLPCEWYRGREGEGLLFPFDGVIEPVARVLAMADAVRARGAQLFADTPWPTDLARAQTTIVAVDGGLEVVLPELKPRVRTTRLQALATAPLEPRYPRPVYRRFGYDYWQQLTSGEIVAGGCRDLFLHSEWGATVAEPTAEVQSAIERLVRDVVVPDVPDLAVIARWAGLVAYTNDGLPVIEEVRPGVIACGGYNGTGNIVGVLAARAAVELALDDASARAQSFNATWLGTTFILGS